MVLGTPFLHFLIGVSTQLHVTQTVLTSVRGNWVDTLWFLCLLHAQFLTMAVSTGHCAYPPRWSSGFGVCLEGRGQHACHNPRISLERRAKVARESPWSLNGWFLMPHDKPQRAGVRTWIGNPKAQGSLNGGRNRAATYLFSSALQLSWDSSLKTLLHSSSNFCIPVRAGTLCNL